MSDPHVYPEAPAPPLLLPAATGNPSPSFISIEQLAALDPSTPKIPKTMFVRVAMSGAPCPGVTSTTAPNFYLQADDGEAVLINDHRQPANITFSVFRRPGSNPVDYIADGSVFLEAHNVFRLVVAFNDGAGDYDWSLGIWNCDAAAERLFTWVVSGTFGNTLQPWVHTTYRGSVPASIKFDAFVGQTSADTGQPVEITNLGTATVTIVDVSPPMTEPYTITGLPLVLDPNPNSPAVVMIGFDATVAGDVPARTYAFVTSDRPDPGPFSASHNVQVTVSAHAASASDSWATKTPMPTARFYLAAAVAGNGKLYAVGGCTGWGEELATVEEYDPASDRWTRRASMPTARSGLGLVAAANGKLYAIGGLHYPSGSNTPLATVEEYDPATDSWTTKAPMPTPRFGLAVAAHSNGKIYAIGGAGPPHFTAFVEEYDLTSNSWTEKAAMPTPRFDFGLAGANGRIYAIGGVHYPTSSVLDTVEEYDPSSNLWVTRTPMPTAQHRLGVAAASNGKIYATGGSTDLNGFQQSAMLAEYDPVANTWATKAPLPTPRNWIAVAATRSGALYAVGGADPHYSAELNRYSL